MDEYVTWEHGNCVIVHEDVTWELGWEPCHCALEVCDFGLKLMPVSHVGETGRTLHGPTYERAQKSLDDW